MPQPDSFPVRQSAAFAASEVIAYALGLMFLSHYVRTFGMESGALFRTALPLVGVISCFGAVGLPQALTRLFAAGNSAAEPLRARLSAALLTTAAAVVISLLAWEAVVRLGRETGLLSPAVADALRLAELWVAVTPASAAARGILIGLGATWEPAAVRVFEAAVRLWLLYALTDHPPPLSAWPVLRWMSSRFPAADPGDAAGMTVLTLGECASALFLCSLAIRRLSALRGVRVPSASGTPARAQVGTLFRLAAGPTGQALVGGLAYALQLPLAIRWLTPALGADGAELAVGAFAAAALPILCTPMVVTDGMATAILPALAPGVQQRRAGPDPFPRTWRATVRAVWMVAVPWSVAALVMAPAVSRWYGAPSAAAALRLMAPLAPLLFLQSPLSALLQARGYSRVLLAAALCDGLTGLAALWLFAGPGHAGGLALPLAFGASTVVETGVLAWAAQRKMPAPVPWRTLWAGLEAGIVATGLLAAAAQLPPPLAGLRLDEHRWLWGMSAAAAALWVLCWEGEFRWAEWRYPGAPARAGRRQEDKRASQ
ncbi:MAG: oligosaccharide flippase family protein [Alicyclobacillaceae bacterium]|nr:oligosaccharide flippase family protein [Alicyclobacillaceae bacterium]